jgi:uncharacterized coiled-coil protein SlyX
MKHAMALALSVALAISVVGAQAQTTTSARKKRVASAKTDPAVTQQLEELKQALDAQQQQIKQLSDQLQGRDQKINDLEQKLDQSQSTATAAQSKADAAASESAQQAQDVSTLKTDVSDIKTNSTNSALTLMETQKESQKTLDAIKALGKLKFTGDLRLRYEPFIGGGAITGPETTSRNRERYRLRFNVNTKIDDDFSAGLTLASGDLGDPISTNSTLTGFYTRKPIAIDKAFAVYNPHYFKPFTLTAGKFGYTWLRTELTWDNDLNPEGGSAALAWDWKHGFVNHFGVVAFGTPMLEVGGGDDSYMYGGQVQTGFNILPRIKLSTDGAYYDFQNADTIAQNQVNGSGANGSATQGLPTPPNFGGTFGFGGSNNTNNFGVIGGKRFYASKYGILDAIARLDFDTGVKRWPVYALFDFAQNTEACDNLGVFFAAGVAAPTCDPHQRHAYWGELQVGQAKNKGDLRLGYTFMRIERDAVLAAFNFSDLRQPTNVAEHRIEAYYQAYPHVQVGFTGLIGRQLVTAQSLTEERWLKRFQFDTIFGF